MQSHDRCCDLCGAFNFAEISYQRGPASTEDRLSRSNANVRLPLNLTPGAVPPDFHRYEARSYPSSAPIRGRTLSLKAALLIACAVGLLAGGLTYLRFGTSSAETEPAYDDTRPVVHTDVDTRSDDPASVAYMSLKAMHDIQDMLNDSHISGSQAASTLREQRPVDATYSPETDRHALRSTSGVRAPSAPTERHPPPAISRADVPQLSVATPAFSVSHDTDALELAIKQYGWKPDPRAKTPR
jgi:hypothetical protein